MRNYFIFGNFDSRDFGLFVSGKDLWNGPAREYHNIAVPGRDGDLLGTEKRLSNVEITYAGLIFEDRAANIESLRNALLSVSGYAELTDSINTSEFRKAVYKGGLEPGGRAGHTDAFDIVFECKPQRYLNSGKTVQTFTSNGSITNPTLFPAKPLIKVTGYGQLTIGSDVITIANVFASVTIDCETMDCYSGSDNANAQVTFQSNDFPELAPGATGINKANTITKVEITPRWWIV